MIFFETCCQSPREACEAEAGGASRIELCDRLEVGGVTPAVESIRQTLSSCRLPINVLIRPRGGDFVYNGEEADAIIKQIHECKALGVNGVVVGALTREGDIDLPLMRRIMDEAAPLEVTFHRAFDECRLPTLALEDIISLGAKRILTSGQAPSADSGRALLRQLNIQAAGRIVIMPGAGIRPENIKRIVEETACREFHGSAHGLTGTTDRATVSSIVNCNSL